MPVTIVGGGGGRGGREGDLEAAQQGFSNKPGSVFMYSELILCTLATVLTPYMGSCYLGYELVLYSPIIYHPVRILGNDYPGMGTVARLHKSAVHGCMHAAWWYMGTCT